MKKIAFLFIILCFQQICAQTNNATWGKKIGSTTDDFGFSCTDIYGNTYVTGYFKSPIVIGTNTYTTTTGNGIETDIFLCKYDASGNLLWSQKSGGIGNDEGRAIAIDMNNNIWVVGKFQDTAFFGNQSISASSNAFQDAFVALYDANGNLQFAKKCGVNQTGSVTGSASFHSIHITSNNDVIVGGSMRGNVSFGTSSYQANNSTNPFLVKINPSNGEILSAKSFGGNNSNGIVYSINTDTLGNIFWGGYYNGSSFMAGFGSNAGISGGFIFKGLLSNFGNHQYFYHINTTGVDEINSVIPDNQGGCVIIGYIDGGSTLHKFDTFLGNGPASGSNNTINEYLVAVPGTNNYYVAGLYSNVSLLNNVCNASLSPANGSGAYDMFVRKMSFDYNCDSLVVFGCNGGFNRLTGLGIDTSSNIYLTGNFSGNICANFLSAQSKDVFIIKIGDNPIPTNPTDVFNSSNSEIFTIFPNPANGEFKIRIENDGTYDLVDLTGKIVSTYVLNKNTHTININLATGLYIFRQRESNAYCKVIIE